MTRPRIVLVALVDAGGAVLLRMRDEQSATRPNRWSLLGGGAHDGETEVAAAHRLIGEQTGLTARHDLRQVWHGQAPGLPADVTLFAAATTATAGQLRVDDVPGAPPRRGEHVLEFVPGADVRSGRPFTPATGHVIGWFLDSRWYERLAAGFDPDEAA